jgi:hypothetical protein
MPRSAQKGERAHTCTLPLLLLLLLSMMTTQAASAMMPATTVQPTTGGQSLALRYRVSVLFV